MGDMFTCENCNGTFEKAWTDKEAEAEAIKEYGNLDDMAMVCDDCWKAMGFS